MARTTALKENIRDLIQAICQVLRDRENNIMCKNGFEKRSTMNIETHRHELAPVDPSHQHPSGRNDPLGQMLPPMLRGKGGLANIPQAILRQNLQPVLNALGKLDAELLLDLELTEHGPRLRDGVLYGDLQRLSLDLAKDDDHSMSIDSNSNGDKKRSWLGGWFNRMESFRHKLPKGSKQAFKQNHIDHLHAPEVTALFPYEGNLHEFVAGPHGAAVLDVLLPPYDNLQNRDCTFYEIQEMTSSWPKPSGKEPCFVVPTGQPENFHCISGQYRDLGEAEDYET